MGKSAARGGRFMRQSSTGQSASSRFLAAYNRIERALRGLAGSPDSFPQLIQRAAKASAAVRRYQNDLRELADLRNAIVHDSIEPSFVIAEPNERAVALIETIARRFDEPQLLIPAFARPVAGVRDDDPIETALGLMSRHGYAQFPVYDGQGKVVGLLNERAIARWCAAAIAGGSQPAAATPVAEVLTYNQYSGSNHAFMAQTATVDDAEEAFRVGRRLEAILISATGDPGERLLGIITAADIARLPE